MVRRCKNSDIILMWKKKKSELASSFGESSVSV